jgi:hypothetical protein
MVVAISLYGDAGGGSVDGVFRRFAVVGALLHLLSWILTPRKASKSLPPWRHAACCLIAALPLFRSAISRLRNYNC